MVDTTNLDVKNESKDPSPTDVEMGKRLRELRQRAGLSQGALAERMGRTGRREVQAEQGRISRYEKGRTPFRMIDLEEFAAALDVDPTELLPAKMRPMLTRDEAELVAAFRREEDAGVLDWLRDRARRRAR